MATDSDDSHQYYAEMAARCGVPDYMVDGLVMYVVDRISPGDFLTRVLENDLMGALGHADSRNQVSLHAYGMFLYSYAPRGAYGSRKKVAAWLEGRT